MSKLHNTQPITAHCHPRCINYLPSLSYQDLREAQQPLTPTLLIPHCSTMEKVVISLRAFLHLHRYAKIQYKEFYHLQPFGGVSYRHSLMPPVSLYYPAFAEGLQQVQHKKDLDSDSQPSSKLQ